jgi:Tol biopolymer transport system component/DNA-binding winged helix-turn-helix (wHTH) protein
MSSNYLQNNFRQPKPGGARIYEFQDYSLDASHLMLYRNGETVPLTPKQVETLVALVEKRGEVVSKDELMSQLWGNTAVEESNLSQNLYILRKVLGTRPDGKPLIETLRRRGYRFNGEIRQSDEIELLVATHTKTVTLTEEETGEPENSETHFTSRLSSRKWKKNLIVVVASLVAGLGLVLGLSRFFQTRSGKTQSTAPLAVLPAVKLSRVTPDQNIKDSAVSPDGKYLAYNLDENDRNTLWLKDLASGGISQMLPAAERSYGDLRFSPDGAWLYYGAFLKTSPNVTVFRMPAFGGDVREVARNVISPVAISRDGKKIAFVRGSTAASSLVIANADGGEEHVLKERSKTEWFESWGSNLSWSPDGSRIAICGAKFISGKAHYELIEVAVADGTERNIPIPDWNYADDVAWLSDGSALLVVARETETSPWQIWRVTYPNGEVRRVTNDTNSYDDLSLSADSRMLITKQRLGNLNLWVAPFDNTHDPKQITFGNAASDGLYGLAFTSEDQIVYATPRSGNLDLWQTNIDGTNQRQLTRNNGEFNGTPRITSDGRYVVFVSSRSGRRQIWRMDIDGGNPQQLTNARSADSPQPSPDGKWIYFNIYEEQKFVIARKATSGEESSIVKESRDYLTLLAISPNGKFLAVAFYDKASQQPWKTGVMSLESGEMVKVFEQPIYKLEGWTPDSAALICVLDDQSNIWLLPIKDGPSRQLTHFKNGQIQNFAVSPDFKQIALSRGNPSTEAILITNFQ